MLSHAQRLLDPLQIKVVFLGGASVSLHVDNAVSPRPTKDVDFVVEATSYAQNALIEEKLRQLGFEQDMGATDAPICRWHKDGLMLDMMPTDPTVLGFGQSKWFQTGFEQARQYTLPNQTIIWAFDALHLIAAKIEAYRDRAEIGCAVKISKTLSLS